MSTCTCFNVNVIVRATDTRLMRQSSHGVRGRTSRVRPKETQERYGSMRLTNRIQDKNQPFTGLSDFQVLQIDFKKGQIKIARRFVYNELQLVHLEITLELSLRILGSYVYVYRRNRLQNSQHRAPDEDILYSIPSRTLQGRNELFFNFILLRKKHFFFTFKPKYRYVTQRIFMLIWLIFPQLIKFSKLVVVWVFQVKL